jgi:N-sulfoglucosamine sulfohydrolase
MLATTPNIVLVIVHDLGQHLGCYGVPTVHSPNLDALAADGVRFANSFCTAPQCSPSRASLYTGRYPHQNGMMGLAHAEFAWDLHAEEEHLATSLARAGYRTALIGFQHETRRPQEMGFHDFDYRWADSSENISDSAARYVDEHAGDDRPFYLQVGIIEPHRRFEMYGGVPDEEDGVFIPPFIEPDDGARADFAGFQGAIRKMDASVGTIVDAVDRSGRADDTLFIFTTDHGMPFPKAKCSLYDAGIEIALIARYPQRGWSGGRVIEPMASNLDLHSTLLELAGAPARDDEGQPIEGRSLTPLLDGSAAGGRDRVFAEMTWHKYYDPMRCVRSDRYKLIANLASAPFIHEPSQMWRPLCVPREPVPQTGHHPDFELYDLDADPAELVNVIDEPEHAEARDGLLADLAGWMDATDDALLREEPRCPQQARVADRLRKALG